MPQGQLIPKADRMCAGGVRATSSTKCKVAAAMFILFIQLQVYLYCCSYSLQHQYSPHHSLSARPLLQCAAAYNHKTTSSSSFKERSWARVYTSLIRRISLVISRRVYSTILLQREQQLQLDANFYRRELKLSGGSHHQRPGQQRRPQRRLAPASPPRSNSITNSGRELSFEDSKWKQKVKQRAETDKPLLLHEAEVQKQHVEEQKRFVPAGPNPLHNRRR